MSQVIEIPGQGRVEFPDGMSDADIVSAIKKIQLGAKVEPNALQRRMGIRIPRVKDDQLLENINKGHEQVAYDVGGAVTDATGSPVAGALTNAVTNVATDPLTYIGGAVGDLAKPIAKFGGERLMQMALKPNKAARDSGDALKAVKTLLEEGANVSKGGVEKLTAKIDALDDQLGQVIKDSKAKLLNTDVLQSLRGVMKEYAAGTKQSTNLQKIRDVAQEFLDHPFFGGGDEMSVQGAQAMKRQNYKELGDRAYGAGSELGAERDALKGINRGLKEGIERVAPETAGLNAQMSPLINARDLAQERALTAGNNNIVSLGWLHPETLIPWMAERSPTIASALARILYSGAAPVAPTVGGAAGAGLGTLLQQQGQE